MVRLSSASNYANCLLSSNSPYRLNCYSTSSTESMICWASSAHSTPRIISPSSIWSCRHCNRSWLPNPTGPCLGRWIGLQRYSGSLRICLPFSMSWILSFSSLLTGRAYRRTMNILMSRYQSCSILLKYSYCTEISTQNRKLICAIILRMMKAIIGMPITSRRITRKLIFYMTIVSNLTSFTLVIKPKVMIPKTPPS